MRVIAVVFAVGVLALASGGCAREAGPDVGFEIVNRHSASGLDSEDGRIGLREITKSCVIPRAHQT